MKRIVVPVDGSEHAVRAAAFAGDLAEKYGAEIILVHVIDRSRADMADIEHMAEVEHLVEPGSQYPWVANLPAELVAMLSAELSEESRRRALNFVAEKVVRSATDVIRRHGVPGGSVRMLIKNGHPVKRILETIKDEDADLVVIGSRGLSDLHGTLLGSVSHRVAHQATCNVVTVK